MILERNIKINDKSDVMTFVKLVGLCGFFSSENVDFENRHLSVVSLNSS